MWSKNQHRMGLAASLVLLAASTSTNAVQVDGIIGAVSNGGSYFVKRFSVPAGSVIVGAELVSNDLQTVFPKVALFEGQGGKLGSLRKSAEIGNVRANSRHLLQVAFPAVKV